MPWATTRSRRIGPTGTRPATTRTCCSATVVRAWNAPLAAPAGLAVAKPHQPPRPARTRSIDDRRHDAIRPRPSHHRLEDEVFGLVLRRRGIGGDLMAGLLSMCGDEI